jgi:DNA end-binding protein Ku
VPRNIISLTDALKRSIAKERKQARKGKKWIQGQGEMLLPISGKKEKDASKPVVRSAGRDKRAG